MRDSSAYSPIALWLSAVALVLISTGASCGARHDGLDVAVEPVQTEYNPVERGREIYATYCQGCHGPEGRGDGPIAPLLTVELSDLSLLVEKYGEFPEELVMATLDGRAEVEGHGSREMPVWGNIWNDPEDPIAEERIDQQIGELVAFVRSIQRAPE